MAQQMPHGQQSSLAADVFQLAQACRIGTPVMEYTSSSVRKLLMGIALSVFGGACILFTILVLLALLFGGFTRGLLILLVLGISLSISLLSYGISLAHLASRNRGAQVYLCTDGLMRVQDGQVEATRWDQVLAVQKVFKEWSSRYGQKSYTLQQYLLQRPGGTQQVLDNAFGRFKELGAGIDQEVTRRLLPGAIAAYNAGRPVAFGPISVSIQGVSVQNGQKALPWQELKTVKVRNGLITLKKEGALLDWETVRTSGMPNLCVFVALVNSITGGQKLQTR